MIKQAMLRIMCGIKADHKYGVLQNKFNQQDIDNMIYDINNKATTYQHPCARIVLQLHDEIILEVHKSIVGDICNILRYAMENIIDDSSVSFPVNIKQGHNLSDMQEVVKESKLVVVSQHGNHTSINYENDNADNISQSSVVSSCSSIDDHTWNKDVSTQVKQAMDKYKLYIKTYNP